MVKIPNLLRKTLLINHKLKANFQQINVNISNEFVFLRFMKA